MPKVSLKISILGSILYLCFFISLCIGPVPIQIFSVKVDFIITSALLAFSLITLNSSLINCFKFPVLLILVYVMLLLPSAILSENFARYGITMIYLTLFIFISHSSHHANTINHRQMALLALIVSSAIILYSYFFSGYSDEYARFRLITDANLLQKGDADDISNNSADPNMTAIGSVLILSFAIVNLNDLPNKKAFIIQGAVVTVTLLTVLLLQSRTAILMMLVLSSLWLFKNRPRSFALTLSIYSASVAIIAFTISATPILRQAFWSSVDRFLNSFVEARASTGRIDYLITDFNNWTESIFSFGLGIGYMSSNPHNEFFRNFSNSGVFVGFLFLFILLIYCYSLHHKIRVNKGSDWSIIYLSFPFFIALSLYGHTKTFWAFLILCHLKTLGLPEVKKRTFQKDIASL